jgi:hypothetical protein
VQFDGRRPFFVVDEKLEYCSVNIKREFIIKHASRQKVREDIQERPKMCDCKSFFFDDAWKEIFRGKKKNTIISQKTTLQLRLPANWQHV